MFSQFFINRPIFAGVIAIIITLAGLIASQVLPVAQYPEIAPPTVVITANYPGASAETLALTVAAPIEEQLSGVENLIYFSSTAATNGTLTIACTFEVGSNADKAVIDVNNRVAIALPRLPDVVRQTGVVAQKRSTDILLVIALGSNDPRYDTLYLSNYATINLLDELKRIPGVADATIFGARDYSMRVWLNPAKMSQLGVTTTDVAQAIATQNNQYAAGKIGAEPAPPGQSLVYTVTARGRLVDPDDFGNIVLRSTGPGGALRIRDVARIELGAVSYDAFTNLDGKPTVGIAVFLQSGGNALKVADSVRAGIARLEQSFPQGVTQVIPFDTTRFVRSSIHEVIITLSEAAALVLLVVFVFLQSWRATLIPIIAVPVSLIGAFARPDAVRFHAEHADPVCDRACDRHRRRRRHRRARERRAADGRKETFAEGRGDRVDEGSDRRHRRDRAGAGVGVRAGGVSRRPCRQALPAIRGDRGYCGHDFGADRVDA